MNPSQRVDPDVMATARATGTSNSGEVKAMRTHSVGWSIVGLAIITVAIGLVSPSYAQTVEDKYREVAKRVPEFAGFYTDSEGNFVVLMTDVTDPVKVDELKDVMRETFSAADLSSMPLDDMTLRQADYAWIELQGYLEVLRGNPIEGNYFRSISKQTNRLVLGVEDPSVESDRVLAELDERGIPREVVTIAKFGPVTPESAARPDTSWVVLGAACLLLALVAGVVAKQSRSRAIRKVRREVAA